MSNMVAMAGTGYVTLSGASAGESSESVLKVFAAGLKKALVDNSMALYGYEFISMTEAERDETRQLYESPAEPRPLYG
jgi:hypothetical protein